VRGKAAPGQQGFRFSEPFVPRTAEAGIARKDAGMEVVSENNEDFMSAALAALPRFWIGRVEALPEDWREWMEERGLVPTHPNAWGALTAQARRRGLIEKTGERRPMKKLKSNGRQTDVYRSGDAAHAAEGAT
jgi:hypothetical protein